MASRNKTNRREITGRKGAPAREGYPYHPGTILKVEFWPGSESLGVDACPHEGKGTGSAGFVQLTAVKTFSRTLSCVLLVSLDLEGLDDRTRAVFIANGTYNGNDYSKNEIEVVLKLYDRRFADGVREDYGAAQWTQKIEEDWRRFGALDEKKRPEVCVEGENNSWLYRNTQEDTKKDGDESKPKFEVNQEEEKPGSVRAKRKRKSKGGNLAKVTDNAVNGGRRCRASGAQEKISPSRWTAGHREAYMQKVCDKSFSTEVSIYQHLRPVQGKSVPLVYGTVRLPIGDGIADEVNGLMMEYIHPSFTLRGIPANVPDKGMWQEVGETAVKVVQDVGECGVLNEDVRLDNVLIVPVKEGYYEDEEDSDNGSNESRRLRFFRAVMIDFGMARARREDEADEEWQKARYFRDEEGAVGFVLEKYLRAAAGSEWEDRPFKFRHSHRLQLQEYDEEADI